MKLDANSFLFTDDHSGIVYYVRKKGWKSEIAARPETRTDSATAPHLAAQVPPPAGTRSCMSIAIIMLAAIVRRLA